MAGSPAQILLLPDRTTIRNDGRALSFMTVKIVDTEGNLCPLADHLIQFRLNGLGKIVAVDNGDSTSLEPFIADYHRAFHGVCLLIVRAVEGASGEIRISASSENIHGSEMITVC